MQLALIPQPKSVKPGKGYFAVPRAGCLGICCQELLPAAELAAGVFKKHPVGILNRRTKDAVAFSLDRRLKEGGYRLRVRADSVTLAAKDAAAAVNGVRTLLQLAAQAPEGRLPCVDIDDWPDFPVRGTYYDICRGRVPKLERLMEQVDILAAHKINHYQLYIEHTFRFRGHPDIGRGADPLTAEDIMKLDRHCRARGVELVPSLASFGHLATVLKHKQYHRLAEDYGVGKYKERVEGWQMHALKHGWSLSPANPDIYKFLDELFSEFLPCFSSRQFNVCCDETWDLGLGQSYELCKKKGKGEVYIGHIVKLNRLCRKHGRKMMFWGDIVRNHPEVIAKIPRDVTVLDWGYNHDLNFDRIRDFEKARLPVYVCPGTSSWVTLFPRIHEAAANIHGYAAAGKKHGAVGLLNTDWGDGGHWHFMELSWHGFLFGAEQAWNCTADLKSFTDRFCRLFLGIDAREFSQALVELGDVAQLRSNNRYQSIWTWVYYNDPKEYDLFGCETSDMCSSKNGKISRRTGVVTAAHGREALPKLERVRRIFAKHAKRKGCDPHRVLPYWLFAVDTLIHAAKKLAVIGPGGKNTPAARRELAREMRALRTRFIKLWLARNRRSEIGITLKKYRRALLALNRPGKATRTPAR